MAIPIVGATADMWFSRPVLMKNDLGNFLLFYTRPRSPQPAGRRGTLYAYGIEENKLRWRIDAQAEIMGFALTDTLYVQDGPVLCAYALDKDAASIITTPIFALPLGGDRWPGGNEQSFKALFAAASPTDRYSAPVVCPDVTVTPPGQERVYVLTSDGTVFAANPLLFSAPPPDGGDGQHIPDQTGVAGEPDRPALYLDPAGSGQLCFVSGGTVAYLPSNETKTPSEGIAAWRLSTLMTSSDQPWLPIATQGVQGFISNVPPAGSQAAAVTVFDASRWSCHLVAPSCSPMLSGAGSMQVQDEASGAIVTHSNAGIPAGVVISAPPQGREASLDLSVSDLLTAPYLFQDQNHNTIVCVIGIASSGGTPEISKPALPQPDDPKARDANDNYFLSWWKAVQSAHDTLQPILAQEIIYQLADETQQAINSGTLPADFAGNSYSSALWSATEKGCVPWDKFHPAAPTYIPLSTPLRSCFAKPIDMSSEFPQEIRDFYMNRLGVAPPLPAPLFGPRPFNNGVSKYFVLSSRNCLYGFTLDGALAWRIPTRVGFQGWIAAGKFLFVTEQSVLSVYDSSRFPSDGSAVLYPDRWMDSTGAIYEGSHDVFDAAMEAKFGSDGQGRARFDTHHKDAWVPYRFPSDPNTIHLHPEESDVAITFDPSTGSITGRTRDVPFTSADCGQTDLNVDPNRVQWRPASDTVPEGIRLFVSNVFGGGGDFDFLEIFPRRDGVGAAHLDASAKFQMNTSGSSIDICDSAWFYYNGTVLDFFAYCCLARGGQYYFARFAENITGLS